MISFIVSAFNRPHDLRVLLASLVAQTSGNWEAVVMDEGDNRAHIEEYLNTGAVRHYPIKRQIVTTDGRGSIGYLAKHAGVEHAHGNYLCFTSEDIYYLPTFVEDMALHDTDIVGCNMMIPYKEIGLHCLYYRPQVTHCDSANTLIRPEVYRRHPYTEFIPHELGRADGLCVQRCVEDGASWVGVPKFLVLHTGERPAP